MDSIHITKGKLASTEGWTQDACASEMKKTKTFPSNKTYYKRETTNLVEIYKSLETHDHYSQAIKKWKNIINQ